MEINNIINSLIKMVYINVLIYVVFIKITNYRENNWKKMCVLVITSIIEECIGLCLVNYVSRPLIMIFTYFIHGFVISKVTRKRFFYSFIISLISLTIIYLIYLISIIISGIIIQVIGCNIAKENIGILLMVIIIESIIMNALFRIKRIKNGIPFLQNENKISNIGVIGMLFIGIALTIYSIIEKTTHTIYIFGGLVIESICMFIWIKQKITKYYKQKLKEKTIEELENEIKEKDKEIKNILEENQRIATINHKYSNRIKALEGFSNKVISKPEIVENMKVEFGDEFLNFEKQVQKLSKEYTVEMEKNIENKIPKTGIFGIDNILEYMNQEATKNNIKFNVKINGNINYMIENIVEQSRLETMLGDHIRDAIIAINSSNNTNKNILLILGIIDEHYEVCIYDTGIEFEIPTLLKLGLEQITTHKATGGSGIGFMTTFETLKSTKASLIIEEKHPMNKTDYTKAVRISFDGKNEYRINTYRAEEIRKENKNGRIIIKNA